jgi:hypothetical protein
MDKNNGEVQELQAEQLVRLKKKLYYFLVSLIDTIVNNWWDKVIASIAIGVDNRLCVSRRMRPTNLDVMI